MLFLLSWPGMCAARMAVTLGLLAQGITLGAEPCRTTMVFGQTEVTLLTTVVEFHSATNEVRSEPSEAQDLRKTRQTSGGVGARLDKPRGALISLLSRIYCTRPPYFAARALTASSGGII